MIWKILISAGNYFTARQIFRLNILAVSREDKLRFGSGVAELSFNAVNVFVTFPASYVTM